MNGPKRWFAVLACLWLSACASDVVLREPAPEPDVVDSSKVRLKRVWSVGLDADTDQVSGSFRPAVVGQQVYVATNEGEISLLDATTGKKVWKIDLDQVLNAGIAASAMGAVVVARSGEVIGLDDKGNELWRTDIAREVVQVPVIHNSSVFLQTSNSGVFALDMVTGALQWTYEARSPALTLRGTNQPLPYQDRLLVSFDSGTLVALNTETGDLLWERKLQIPKGANEFERIIDLDGRMTLKDNIVFVPGYQGFLTAVEAYTGQVLWQKELSSDTKPGLSVDRLFIANADSHLLNLDYRNGEVQWQSETFEYRELTSPLTLGQYLVATDMDGQLYVLDKSNADVLFKKKIGDAPIQLISVENLMIDEKAEEIVIAQSANGKIQAYRLNELETQ